MSLDVSSAISGVSDAQVAVLAVLGSLMAFFAITWATVRVIRLLAPDVAYTEADAALLYYAEGYSPTVIAEAVSSGDLAGSFGVGCNACSYSGDADSFAREDALVCPACGSEDVSEE